MVIHLFVYGTLRNHRIQKRVLGRTPLGTVATIEGYRKVRALLHGEPYPFVIRDDRGYVNGKVLLLREGELARLDAYEDDIYERRRVLLSGGHYAWFYFPNPRRVLWLLKRQHLKIP